MPPTPETTPEGCPADPQDKPLRNDCQPDVCVVRTGVETGYETSTYVVGHVPGGDHGTTYWFWVDCTVPTTPTPNLPNTGGNGPALAITALALVALGAACLACSRRPEVE